MNNKENNTDKNLNRGEFLNLEKIRNLFGDTKEKTQKETKENEKVNVDKNSDKKISRRKILGIFAGGAALTAASAADRLGLGKLSELAGEHRDKLRKFYYDGDRESEFVEGGKLTTKEDVLKFSINNQDDWNDFVRTKIKAFRNSPKIMNNTLFLNFTEIQDMDDTFRKQIIEDLKNNISELSKTFSKLVVRIAKKPTIEIPIHSPSTEKFSVGLTAALTTLLHGGLRAFAKRKKRVAAVEKRKGKKEDKKRKGGKKESLQNALEKTAEFVKNLWQTGNSGIEYYSEKHSAKTKKHIERDDKKHSKMPPSNFDKKINKRWGTTNYYLRDYYGRTNHNPAEKPKTDGEELKKIMKLLDSGLRTRLEKCLNQFKNKIDPAFAQSKCKPLELVSDLELLDGEICTLGITSSRDLSKIVKSRREVDLPALDKWDERTKSFTDFVATGGTTRKFLWTGAIGISMFAANPALVGLILLPWLRKKFFSIGKKHAEEELKEINSTEIPFAINKEKFPKLKALSLANGYDVRIKDLPESVRWLETTDGWCFLPLVKKNNKGKINQLRYKDKDIMIPGKGKYEPKITVESPATWETFFRQTGVKDPTNLPLEEDAAGGLYALTAKINIGQNKKLYIPPEISTIPALHAPNLTEIFVPKLKKIEGDFTINYEALEKIAGEIKCNGKILVTSDADDNYNPDVVTKKLGSNFWVETKDGKRHKYIDGKLVEEENGTKKDKTEKDKIKRENEEIQAVAKANNFKIEKSGNDFIVKSLETNKTLATISIRLDTATLTTISDLKQPVVCDSLKDAIEKLAVGLKNKAGGESKKG